MNSDQQHQELVKSIVNAVSESMARCPQQNEFNGNEVMHLMATEYLTGISQAVYVLRRHDGSVTPHQIDRALNEAAVVLGFGHLPPRK